MTKLAPPQRLKSLLRVFGFSFYLLITTSLLSFLLLEAFPQLLTTVNFSRIPYYAVKSRYVADDNLVFRTRIKREDKITYGDLFRSYREFAGDIKSWRYQATYNEYGFRTNTRSAPFRILVIGDSFAEIGESDSTTISELLASRIDSSVANVGLGWYGPYQYLELFKQYVPIFRPEVVVVHVFAGNDIQDLIQYESWRNGGGYYHFSDQSRNIGHRYLIAIWDLLWAIKNELKDFVRPYFAKLHDAYLDKRSENVGMFKIAATETPMAFLYWNERKSANELLETSAWRGLKGVMRDLSEAAKLSGTRLVVVLIPSKLEVYARTASQASNGRFKLRLADQLRFEDNFLGAFEAVATELNLEFINLYTLFRRLAFSCLLYHPFDTHWNIQGRHVAAAMVADYLSAESRSVPSRPDYLRVASVVLQEGNIAGCHK
jgi:hypothetical protein